MTVDSRLLVSWIRDVLIAYAGGLLLGAPVAVLSVWMTGRPGAATVSLLLAMGVLLVGLRRAAREPQPHARATPAVRRQAA